MTTHDEWIRRMRPNPGARARLLCIPYAGGGAWSFRTWPDHLPADVEVLAVQLPGREDRLGDEPIPDVHRIVEVLAGAVEPALNLPFAVFGHSMGALVGFELLRALRRRGAPGASLLCASAFRAPQLPRSTPPLHELPDDAFVEEVNRRYAAVPPAARESPELMELVLPALRADVSVCDSYTYRDGEPLDCPIHAFGGTDDDHVGRQQLEPWAEQTRAAFGLDIFPGDHFFLQTAQAPLLAAVGEALGRTTG